MANGFREVIELRPRADRALQFLACVAGPAAVAAAWLAAPQGLPPGARVALLAAVALGLGWACLRRRTAWPRRAVLLADGSWRLVVAGGEVEPARLRAAWGHSAGPVIGLEWTGAAGRGHSLWVLRRDTDAVTWRRLRVRLRIA